MMNLPKLDNKTLQFIALPLILIVLTIIFTSNLSFSVDMLPNGGDFITFAIAEAFILEERLRDIDFPFWNWDENIPTIGHPTTSFFYISTPLYLLASSVSQALAFEIFLHFIIAGLCMFALARYLKTDFYGSLSAAIIFAFSGSFVSRIFAGHLEYIHAIPWIPLIFYFYLKALDTGDRRQSVFAGAVMALQIYAGGLNISLFTGLALAFITLFYIFHKKEWQMIRAGVTHLLIVSLTAFGIAAMKLLTVVEVIPFSSRGMGLSQAGLNGGSIPFKELLLALFSRNVSLFNGLPKLAGFGWWEFSSYLGPFIILLAALSFYAYRDKYSYLFASLFVFTAIVAMGSYFPINIYGLLTKIIPILAALRIPARALIIAPICIGILAGRSVTAIGNSFKRKRANSAKAILVIAIFVSLFVFGSQHIYSENFDLSKYDSVGFEKDDNVYLAYSEGDYQGEARHYLQLEGIRYLTYGDPSIDLWTVFHWLNFDPLENKRAVSVLGVNKMYYQDELHEIDDPLPTAYAVGCKALVVDPYAFDKAEIVGSIRGFGIDPAELAAKLRLPSPINQDHVREIINDGDDDLSKLVFISATPESVALNVYPRMTYDIVDDSTGTFTETGSGSFDSSVCKSSTAEIVSSHPTYMKAKIETPENNMVFVQTEPFFPAFKCYVDGESEDLILVNGVARGCVISEAGDHEVEIKYSSWFTNIGIIITLISLLFLLFLVKREFDSHR